MIKVLIIEDEKPAAQKLQALLLESESNMEIIDTLTSVEDAINWFETNEAPDLIFMDIQLDDGICFEIFDSVQIKTPVIFTTAYDEYAIKAFKVNSIDYLLKPIKKEALRQSLEKYKEYYANSLSQINTDKLNTIFPNTFKERFFIKIGIKYKSILTKDINCFYINEGNAFLLTKEGKNYDIDYSLDKIEKMVDPRKYFRVNRNFLINIDAIKEIIAWSSNRLKLDIDQWKDEDIIVSRDRIAAFKNWMDR